MKATIEHVQAAKITAETTAQAVDIAASLAMESAERATVKAAREVVRAAMMEDPDWQEAKKLKAEMRKATAGTREEIQELEGRAKARQEETDAAKCLRDAKDRAGGIRKASLARREPQALRRLIAETRRAELVHWALWPAWLGTALWLPPTGVLLNLLFASLFNLPCLLLQRYNRLRLQRLLQEMEEQGMEERSGRPR